MAQSVFFKDQPLFGLDIGSTSLKAMQVIPGNKKFSIQGYGVADFDSKAIQKGVITDYVALASALKELFEKRLVGKITTRRVAVSLPVAYTFNRIMTLPVLSGKDLAEAIRNEAERYIPLPVDSLYLDYAISIKREKDMDVLLVAAPRTIIDSYYDLMRIIGLELVVLEPTMTASCRQIMHNHQDTDVPTILIDFGSLAVDMSILDKNVIVTGTSNVGGDLFTKLIKEKFGVTRDEAYTMKIKYGISASKQRGAILDALKPALDQLIRELKKMVRYYDDRTGGKRKIDQIITMGGGANLPGLSEYLTEQLRVPSRTFDPWRNVTFGHLQPPHETEKSIYVTAAGLALIKPEEIFV